MRACNHCYTPRLRVSPLNTPMTWLLPLTIVLLASVALAAVHYFFTRYLARLSEPVRIEPSDGTGDSES